MDEYIAEIITNNDEQITITSETPLSPELKKKFRTGRELYDYFTTFIDDLKSGSITKLKLDYTNKEIVIDILVDTYIRSDWKDKRIKYRTRAFNTLKELGFKMEPLNQNKLNANCYAYLRIPFNIALGMVDLV